MARPRIRVLLVEDDEEDLMLTRELLQSRGNTGYEVDSVRTYGDAILAIERKAYDVCLVDYLLGAENGLQFIRHCSGLGLGLPIILLTGCGSDDIDDQALQAGACDYLTKGDLTAPLLDRSIRYSIERVRSLASIEESRQLLASSLDALSIHIAILDESANILAANRAWRKFGERNGLKMPNGAVGANYLEICARAMSAGDEAAGCAHRAIQDVIANRWSEFAMEYPCHSPAGKRWFTMRVTRFTEVGSCRVVVAHDIATERHLAEEALAQSERRFRALVEKSSGAALLAGPDESIIYASPAAEPLLGRPAAEILGRRLDEFLYPADREYYRQTLTERLKTPGSSDLASIRVRQPDGTLRLAAGTVANHLRDPSIAAVVYNFTSQGPEVRE